MVQEYPARKGERLDRTERAEQRAVEAAIAETAALPSGQERLLVVELVFWKGTHTLEGAAVEAHCGGRTAQRYSADFIRAVARNFQCRGLS